MAEAASEDRAFASLPPAREPGEQRTAARFTPLIRTAKLVAPTGEFLCVVSDVSEKGVSARLFHPLPADRALALEMPNGERLPLEPVWEDNGRAGFRFSGPVDLDRIVGGHGQWPKRPIRLNLEMPVAIGGLSGTHDATLRNISSQGAQIECAARLALDQRVRLSGGALPQIEAKVRWRNAAAYGLVFDSLIAFAELARIAGIVQGLHGPSPDA